MRTWSKKNANSGTKKMTMMKMIAKKINMKRKMKIGTIYLTGSSLWTLYCPYIYPP